MAVPLPLSLRLTLRLTANNLFFAAFDERGVLLLSSSCGSAGHRGPRRSTPLAAEQTARSFALRLQALSPSSVRLLLQSPPGRRTRAALRGLAAVPLPLVGLQLAVAVPHNGVRPPKRRRL